MLYIDPSEMRSTSKWKKLTSWMSNPAILDIPSRQLDDLETRTGADIMISPSGLQHPMTDMLLHRHITSGAYLVQVKFDHDLIASIIDGRFKESQSRMIESGAAPWQRILLFIGFISENEKGFFVNNKRPVDIIGGAAKNFTKTTYFNQTRAWTGRGGSFEQINAYDLPMWIKSAQKALDNFHSNPQKFVYPASSVRYEEELEEYDNETFIEKELRTAQKLTPITGIRRMWFGIPGWGPERINNLHKAMLEAKIHPSQKEFELWLEDGRALKVKGVGKKLISSTKKFLEGNE